MDWMLYFVAPGAFLLGSLIAAMLRRKATQPAARARLAKLSVGLLGSAAIIWSVFLLADMLQLVVILFAIGYLAKTLAYAGPLRLPRLTLARKQIR